ncbi:GPP34 family phosphoprotein [Demequina sp. NBRC 110053]|uniref:GOLPH3/VPS74 family protein n=1 Tax=Demequina sp. NBRC 110053 TaxID=1570342 RepID=UPI001F1B40F5|nr:GPP34 family phosphoprotein [Demequina sp. NBRC 110053]
MTSSEVGGRDHGEPTIAEDLMLVLFEPRTGHIHGEGTLFYPLAGAILSELALDERIALDQSRSALSAAVTASGEPPADPLLQDTWDRIAAKPQRVHTLLAAVGPSLRTPVLDRLVENGHVTRSKGRFLKIFPTTTLADGGTGRRQVLMEQLRPVFVDGVEPNPRIAVIGALLSANGSLYALHREIPWSGDVHRRGKQLEKGDWGAQGVGRAVGLAAATVALTSVTSAAAIASTS